MKQRTTQPDRAYTFIADTVSRIQKLQGTRPDVRPGNGPFAAHGRICIMIVKDQGYNSCERWYAHCEKGKLKSVLSRTPSALL
jgi:hypothetical protein